MTGDISIKHIYKSFGNTAVLKDLSLVIRKGGIYRLEAPSGAGKTSFLRILMGLEKADSGSIEGLPDRISVLFQEDRLLEQLSVYDNIALVTGTAMRGLRYREPDESGFRTKAAHEINNAEGSDRKYDKNIGISPEDIYRSLSELGLMEAADKKVCELSGGMKRRAALARAALYSSELLLLDEPFTGLDPAARKLAAEYIIRHTGGRSCIIAGHIAEPAIDECSELIDLK